jgi:hypothetical protein
MLHASHERAPSRRSLIGRRGATIAALVLLGTATVTAAGVALDAVTGAHTLHGAIQPLGNGTVRTYINVDAAGKPVEVGVAMDERALEGLRGREPGHAHGHDMDVLLLPLPAKNATPYNFVELDWNPGGHEPPGIYDTPHFDFHFWTVSQADRDAIVPSDSQYGARAGRFPDSSEVLPGWVAASTLMGAPPAAAAVPRMGMHWINPASPELPPTLRPFTQTFIMGSWDGKVVFHEPMITRDYILAKKTAMDSTVRNEVIEIPVAPRYSPAGYYPNAYRISWDPTAREYRVALTGLAWRE